LPLTNKFILFVDFSTIYKLSSPALLSNAFSPYITTFCIMILRETLPPLSFPKPKDLLINLAYVTLLVFIISCN